LGGLVYIQDGSVHCQIIEILDESIKVKILQDAELHPNKTINLPGCIVDLPTLTEKDESDICDFGMKKGIDMIAASFVRK